MIYLFSGLNGSGKTQRALARMLDWDKEGRPCFYTHVPFKFIPAGWKECKPEDWRMLPPKSVFLIDECQNYFPGGQQAFKLPEWVLKIAEHRHLGIDFLLVTPNPSMMAKFVRDLVGEWSELTRIFGKHASWVTVRAKCSDTAEVLSKTAWVWDKKIWSLYQSSKEHTEHGHVPFKVKAYLVLALAIVSFFGYTMWNSRLVRGQGAPIADVVAATTPPPPSPKPALAEPVITSARSDCPVLVGVVLNETRKTGLALLENDAGHIIRVSIPHTGLPDDWTWRGCRYYLAGGSLVSVDSGRASAAKVARARAQEEREGGSDRVQQQSPLDQPAVPSQPPRQSPPPVIASQSPEPKPAQPVRGPAAQPPLHPAREVELRPAHVRPR
ncbi:MAG: hypothetical protein C4555_00500 [Dehalococcoidia bacterium]|nr:MAG: hypothetical protein C4555_00500 [Dehalococcoidia bacterium]